MDQPLKDGADGVGKQAQSAADPVTYRDPDFAAAGRHLQFITGERSPIVCLQFFDDRGDNRSLAEHRHGTLMSLRSLLRTKQRQGCGAFVTVGRTDGHGRKRANITEQRVVFIDLDGKPLPKKWRVTPHLIIETSPGRFHAYWRLETPVTDLNAWSDLQARLAAFYGGDPTVIDPPRVLRLAGYWHLKNKDAPFQSRIVMLESGPFQRTTLAEMVKAHPCEYTPPKSRGDRGRAEAPDGGWDAGDSIERATEWLKTADPAVERAGGDHRTFVVACFLRDFGISPEKALELMQDHWNDRCSPPWDADDLQTKIINAYHYASGDAGSQTSAADDFAASGDDDAESTGSSVPNVIDHGLVLNKAGRAMDTIVNALSAVHRAGLNPAWDELAHTIQFRAETLPWDESYGRVVDGNLLRVVRFDLINRHQGVDYQPSKEHLDEAIMTLGYGKKFNPVVEYLDGLRWDGVPRVDRLFTDYFKCGDNEYERAVSRCFMIGAVRRMRNPGCKFDTVPLVLGPTGIGKSSAFRALFTDKWFGDPKIGDLRDKDSSMVIEGKWFIEFPELAGVRNAEVEEFKAFFSRQSDRYRRPWGHGAEDHPRRCVFGGTGNLHGVLLDPTGARRVWPMRATGEIDLKKIVTDRDQLWAEAAWLEALGEPDVLPKKLWSVAADRQEDETTIDPWTDTIRSFLERRQKAAADYAATGNHEEDEVPLPAYKVHASSLFAALGVEDVKRTTHGSQRIRTIMEQTLGWKHRRGLRIGGSISTGFERA